MVPSRRFADTEKPKCGNLASTLSSWPRGNKHEPVSRPVIVPPPRTLERPELNESTNYASARNGVQVPQSYARSHVQGLDRILNPASVRVQTRMPLASRLGCGEEISPVVSAQLRRLPISGKPSLSTGSGVKPSGYMVDHAGKSVSNPETDNSIFLSENGKVTLHSLRLWKKGSALCWITRS